VGMIAAAFYPRPVIVRFSDFKTNEYRDLIGGGCYEPQEENPMLGWRGAARYSHPDYKDIFALECAAMKKVRETMGLTNLKLMIPFVRTVPEAQAVLQEMEKNGLARQLVRDTQESCDKKDMRCAGSLSSESGEVKESSVNLEIIMMCEIPANIILIEQFSKLFDGFSIGSNDLTQLTLGVDRDSALLASLFDERDPAVQALCAQAIAGAHAQGRYIGICGQAPSDYPEFADFLIAHKIDSLSLNRDAVLSFLKRYPK
jgi:pyruvate,water dikinase